MIYGNLQEQLNVQAVCNRDYYNVFCFLDDHKEEQSYARYFDIRNINPKHCFEYLKIDNPNLDILMSALELKEPETIDDLSHILSVFYQYCFIYNSCEDEFTEIANKHPEVIDFAKKKLLNHEYKLDDDHHFIDPPFLKFHTIEHVSENINAFAFSWLVDDVVLDIVFSKNHFKMMNYKQDVLI